MRILSGKPRKSSRNFGRKACRNRHFRADDGGPRIGDALLESGFQSSFSISWLPVEYSYSKDKTRGPGAIDFKRVKLLEISCVTIPSDMSATVQRKAQEGDVKGAAIALGVNLAIKEIEPHVAEVAIREASRMLSEDSFVRSVAERATFFAVADDTFRKLSKIMK